MKSKYDIKDANGTVNNEKSNVPDRNSNSDDTEEVSTFRRILPQILASTAKNFLLVDLGLAAAFPAIVIPVLRRIKLTDPEETLYFTPEQASWFGSIAYICQPLGSVLSGWISEPFGRKKAMILVNIPHIIGWLMLHFATSLEEIYIAAVLLGLGIGFMEAPIVTYVGEICQPSIRGILTSCAGVAATLGVFTVYLLGTSVLWRDAALICLAVPLSTVIAISFVPETPYWLLSKNRKDDAVKSLQWLRGWVSKKAVEKEFSEMQIYSKNATKCYDCQKSGENICNHPPPTFPEKLKELLRSRTVKPFLLVISCFLFSQFTGIHAMRPYIVQIFKAYGTPIDANWATVIFGSVSVMANIICMCIIKVVGKRKLSLISITGATVSCLTLGFYGYNVFPSGYNSFENLDVLETNDSNYLPMMLFFFLTFFTSLGLSPVPWMLLSEVFPFKTRGSASGITAAISYIMAFISTKTYFNLEIALSLYGVAWLYGAIGIIGFIYYYFMLPETENRTLEEIELHYAKKDGKFSDINIQKKDMNACVENIEMVAGGDNSIKKGCDNKGYIVDNSK